VEKDDVARVREQRRDVAGREHLVFTDAEDERRVLLGDDDLVGRAPLSDGDGVRAAEHLSAARTASSSRACPLALRLVDQVRDDLGVGVARETYASGLELAPQRDVVLDDPVVDDRDCPAT
jgi:hypothetical protein